jgi:hypothetical protein
MEDDVMAMGRHTTQIGYKYRDYRGVDFVGHRVVHEET